MCKFFSAISDGKGKTIFMKPKDIGKIVAEGNPKKYNPNSHTSIADYHGIKGAAEDKYNKWEYDVDKKTLNIDDLNTKDDSVLVKKAIEKFLKGKDTAFLRNLYGLNNGYRNNGNQNNGDRNNGNQNNGHRNNGYQNNGHQNNGDKNNGNQNNGNQNNGHQNNGHQNNGNQNNGDRNNGNQNNGDRNNGNQNNGDRNNGNQNNGVANACGGVRNSFCTEDKFFLFNKPCTEAEHQAAYNLPYFDFNISEFIYEEKMTTEEKEKHPEYKVTSGFVRVMDYKECWKYAPKNYLEAVKKLANFDAVVFETITGLKI